jgi:polyhydroxybutyrate depolymerase
MFARPLSFRLLPTLLLYASVSCADVDNAGDDVLGAPPAAQEGVRASADASVVSPPADAGAITTSDTGARPTEAPLACPASSLPPGDTSRTLQVNGTARSYKLHIPKSYTGKGAVPFVIDWHSLMGNAAGQERLSGYRALSDQEGFIVAWPTGIDQAWNVGPCCTKSRAVDDVAFAKAIVADVKARACVDAKRVYSTGYSMGGGMSHHLACNAADVFAAVAPAAFDLLADDEQPCTPKRPITVISFRGTADPIVPYAGGSSRPPNGLNVTIHFLGAEKTFQKWAQLNGCTGTATTTAGGCRTYTQCKEGSEVTLCTKQGGSHEPGDAKLGWQMLKKHPMP